MKSQRRSPHWPLLAAAALMGGVALVGGAVQHDPLGWFGQVTAAWVQALGSVVAIIAAIVIDQGSARRQREQFDYSEMLRKRECIEAALAAATLAGFAYRWLQHTHTDIHRRTYRQECTATYSGSGWTSRPSTTKRWRLCESASAIRSYSCISSASCTGSARRRARSSVAISRRNWSTMRRST